MEHFKLVFGTAPCFNVSMFDREVLTASITSDRLVVMYYTVSSVSPQIASLIGIKMEPPVTLVLRNWDLIRDSGITSDEAMDVMTSIYEFFSGSRSPLISNDQVQQLTIASKRCFLMSIRADNNSNNIKNEWMHPSHLFVKSESILQPYVFEVPATFRRYQQLFATLGVIEEPQLRECSRFTMY